MLPFLTPLKPFFFYQILCQHISVLHQTVQLIQVDLGSQPTQMPLEPAG